jgi:hypothetical protein
LLVYADESWAKFFEKVASAMDIIQPLVFLFVALMIVLIYAAMLLPIYAQMDLGCRSYGNVIAWPACQRRSSFKMSSNDIAESL